MTVSRIPRVLLLATALLTMTGLVACTGGTVGPAAEGNAAGSAESSLLAGFPGLHVTPDVAILTEDDSRARLATLRSCDELSGMLSAGQWRLVDRVSHGAIGEGASAMMSGFGSVAGDLLQRGDRLVFAALEGGETCSATVADVFHGDLVLEGAGLPGTTPGWVAATRCYRSADTGAITVSVYFDTDDKVGGQGQFVLLPSGGDYVVDSADGSSLTMNLLSHGDRFLSVLTSAYSSLTELPFLALAAGEDFTGDAVVETDADGLPSGQVVLRGLVADDELGYDDYGDDQYEYDEYEYDDDSGAGEISMTLHFACAAIIETK